MKRVMIVFMFGMSLAAAAIAADKALLAPTDAILAVDADGLVSKSGYPAAEGPANVLDNNAGTKYLNFARENSGFIVTPYFGSSILQSFVLTTANDAPGRDPASWTLWGTNSAIASADNSAGLGEPWTLIGSGSVSLPDDRFYLGPVVSVANSTAYTSYKMMYPTLKAAGNLMQVADVAFFQSSDGTGTSFLSTADSILAVQAGQDSSYPANEKPANAIDGTNNKYLNFGKTNSGFIVTPGQGATIVHGFQITTANDTEARDPATWILYGTNDVILSGDNTQGTAENWIQIATGSVTLPSARDTLGDLVTFANNAEFTSYKLLFPTLKDAAATNSMQIAEIQFYGVPEPTTLCLLGLGGLAMLRRRS